MIGGEVRANDGEGGARYANDGGEEGGRHAFAQLLGFNFRISPLFSLNSQYWKAKHGVQGFILQFFF